MSDSTSHSLHQGIEVTVIRDVPFLTISQHCVQNGDRMGALYKMLRRYAASHRGEVTGSPTAELKSEGYIILSYLSRELLHMDHLGRYCTWEGITQLTLVSVWSPTLLLASKKHARTSKALLVIQVEAQGAYWMQHGWGCVFIPRSGGNIGHIARPRSQENMKISRPEL